MHGANFTIKNSGSRSVKVAIDVYRRDNRNKFVETLVTKDAIQPGKTAQLNAGGNRCAKFIRLFEGEPGTDITKYNTDGGDFNNEGKVPVIICDDATIELTTKPAPGVNGTVQWHINAPTINPRT